MDALTIASSVSLPACKAATATDHIFHSALLDHNGIVSSSDHHCGRSAHVLNHFFCLDTEEQHQERKKAKPMESKLDE
jgi:hypothetical protein